MSGSGGWADYSSIHIYPYSIMCTVERFTLVLFQAFSFDHLLWSFLVIHQEVAVAFCNVFIVYVFKFEFFLFLNHVIYVCILFKCSQCVCMLEICNDQVIRFFLFYVCCAFYFNESLWEQISKAYPHRFMLVLCFKFIIFFFFWAGQIFSCHMIILVLY